MRLERSAQTLRVATFNADLNRKGAGVLLKDMDDPDEQILAVVEIILTVRPDILLINEIDWDPQGLSATRLRALLAEGIRDAPGLDYPNIFTGAVNTGVASGFDLDGDGKIMGSRDALGFGRFPGQYGMAMLAREGLAFSTARTFRMQPWSEIPWVEQPMNPDGTPYYRPDAWAVLPVSSKSHWDLTVRLPDGRDLHLLASHPTPPVFDGPEDRNGLRNAAEIRFWADYIDGAAWITDDAGQTGGLSTDAHFVVLGDLNNDPVKGDGDNAAIRALTGHARIRDPKPASPGAAAAGDAHDTAEWPEKNGPGNLRVDYALPSASLTIRGSGVFWPEDADPLARLTRISGRKRASSDHRLVWVDIALETR